MKPVHMMFLLVFGMLFSITAINAQDKIDFSTELLSGDEIQFSEMYANGVTLVNFWALWCKPCRVEMKTLKRLYEKYSNQEFQILGINQDSPRSVAKVESYIVSHEVKYHIALDPNKELFEMFNGQVVPLTLLYDKSGKVVYQSTGYLPGDEFKLEEAIRKTLEAE